MKPFFDGGLSLIFFIQPNVSSILDDIGRYFIESPTSQTSTNIDRYGLLILVDIRSILVNVRSISVNVWSIPVDIGQYLVDIGRYLVDIRGRVGPQQLQYILTHYIIPNWLSKSFLDKKKTL